MANTYNPIENFWDEEPALETVAVERVVVFPVERFVRLETNVENLGNIKSHIWASAVTASGIAAAVCLAVIAIVYQSMQTTMEVAKASQPVVQTAQPPVIINIPAPQKPR